MKIKSKRFFPIVISVVIVFIFAGCGSDNASNENGGENKNSGVIAIPSAIKEAALPGTGTLTAKIFIGSNITASASKTVAVTDTEVSFTLKLNPGDYTFTIVFEYDDPVFNTQTWELARATSASVTVNTGTSTPVTFPAYAYADDDSDGITNLAELDESARTDPNDPTCLLDDAAILGGPSQSGCSLG